jgi:hypothetical protein
MSEPMPIAEQRKLDATAYLEDVLRRVPASLQESRDIHVKLSEMILNAYLQGREDEDRAATSTREQRKLDAIAYLKGVLRGIARQASLDVQVMLGEMILHTYLRARDDESIITPQIPTPTPKMAN